MTAKEQAHALPDNPGVYMMKNRDDRIIYVGKAKNLRKRVTSYFLPNRDAKTTALVEKIDHIDYIITGNEYEALVLENNLIKRHNPHYNILLKDGKSYPIEMADNADARTFLARLPMTLTFENFGRNERIAYPKPALELERSARHFEITRGTMTVYKPWGNIAIFLVDFPWSSDLADLGQISPEGLETIRKSGDKPLTFFK